MQRDTALIHKILRHVEEQPKDCHIPRDTFKGSTPEQVTNHEKLCEEAGYLESTGSCSLNPNSLARAKVYRLTWEGHEALARFRNGDPHETPEQATFHP